MTKGKASRPEKPRASVGFWGSGYGEPPLHHGGRFGKQCKFPQLGSVGNPGCREVFLHGVTPNSFSWSLKLFWLV